MRIRPMAACLLLAAALLSGGGAPGAGAEEAAEYYAENEWNYVDESMDTAGGIPEDAPGALGRIARRGVLRVATSPSLSAVSYIDPNRSGDDMYAGADIRLARLIAERMGVGLKIIPMDEYQVLPSLTEEQCDLALSGVTFTPARGLSYTMSRAYWYPEEREDIGIVIREEDRETVTGLNDLADRRLAAQKNSLPETFGVKQATKYREFLRVTSAREVFEEVAAGRADIGLVSVRTAETWLKSHPESGLILAEGMKFTPAKAYQGYRAAAKKGETQLIAFVNGVIDEITKSGAYARWLREGSGQTGR